MWELQLEQEACHARLAHDPLVQRELDELEEEGVHLAAELHVMSPFAERADNEAAAAAWRLPSVPAALERELDEYQRYRAEPLNRFRSTPPCST